MIYELRVYHCMPGRLQDLLKRYETVTLGLLRKYEIEPVAFWTVVVGESSQDFIYVLRWQSMAEREQKWSRFQADPDWIATRHETERNGPFVASLTNSFLKPTSFSPLP
jgi:hypothetical protein